MADETKPEQTKVKMVTVRVPVTVEHDGKVYAPGQPIRVEAVEAAALVRRFGEAAPNLGAGE